MRASGTLLLLFGLMLGSPAAAQMDGPPHAHARGHRAHGPDSTRFLPRWLHSYAELGPGWMQLPVDIRTRYGASLSLGLGLDVDPVSPLQLAVRGNYYMLTPKDAAYSGFYDPNSPAPGYELTGGGTGHLIDLLFVTSLRARGPFWIEGGVGGGHFGSGYPDEAFQDPLTGNIVDIVGKSAWGGAFSIGTRYEFQPTPRDHLFALVRWETFDDRGTALQFWTLRAGYRFP